MSAHPADNYATVQSVHCTVCDARPGEPCGDDGDGWHQGRWDQLHRRHRSPSSRPAPLIPVDDAACDAAVVRAMKILRSTNPSPALLRLIVQIESEVVERRGPIEADRKAATECLSLAGCLDPDGCGDPNVCFPCPCGCPPDMHIGEIGCPCALPGEPPCVVA